MSTPQYPSQPGEPRRPAQVPPPQIPPQPLQQGAVQPAQPLYVESEVDRARAEQLRQQTADEAERARAERQSAGVAPAVTGFVLAVIALIVHQTPAPDAVTIIVAAIALIVSLVGLAKSISLSVIGVVFGVLGTVGAVWVGWAATQSLIG